MIEDQSLSQIPGLGHGFFGRTGGQSTGLYGSLNCGLGSGDNKDTVLDNRKKVAACLNLSPDRLINVYQYHSPEVVTVTEPWDMAQSPRADGMVTNTRNIGIGVLTADCAPVLFADKNAGVIGAAHAGWRGAVMGVSDNIITAMENLGAKRASIIAVIGPTISQQAYEVGPEFFEAVVQQDADHKKFFLPSTRQQHFKFDLPGYLIQRLERANLGVVSCVNICTYAQDTQYFSYRRATHNCEKDYGRQISVITMS